MRLIIDTLVAAMLAALLSGILTHQQRAEERERDYEALRVNVRQIQQQVMLRVALDDAVRNEFGFPTTIDPEWFGETPPLNPLLSLRHPWVEVASPHEWDQDHPTVKTATDPRYAMFWYNPRKGMVRARVPHLLSDERTVEVYNYVNNAAITSLYVAAPDSIDLETLQGADDELRNEIDEELRAELTDLGVADGVTTESPVEYVRLIGAYPAHDRNTRRRGFATIGGSSSGGHARAGLKLKDHP